MNHHITIEDRLESFAENGMLCGFTLKLWNSKAKSLEKMGIMLRNPISTGRKGEYEYEIDFSIPIPGTFSEELYNIAMAYRKENGEVLPTPEPINLPYDMD